MEAETLRFIGEPIEVHFDHSPALEKKPGCPDEFTWRETVYRVVEKLGEWHDYRRRGRMARNMQPQHAAVAESRRLVGRGTRLFPGAHRERPGL